MTNAERALIEAVLAGGWPPDNELIQAVREERYSQPCFDFLLQYEQQLQSARKSWALGREAAIQQWGADVVDVCIQRLAGERRENR